MHYDALRCLACFMVIVIHVSAQNWYVLSPTDSNWRIMNFYDSLARSAVPIFFMISGALFLDREVLSVSHLMKRNVLRLIYLYIAWSVLYAIDRLGIHNIVGNWHEFYVNIIKSNFHMWFLPAMVCIYIIMPVLYAVTKYDDGKYEKYLLVVWGIFGVLKTTILLIPDLPDGIKNILGKFSVDLCQYAGYVLLGHYLKHHIWMKRRRYILGSGFAIVVCFASVVGAKNAIAVGKPNGLLYGYLTLPVCLEAIFLFLLFETKKEEFSNTHETLRKILKEGSSCTLGIYMIHPYIYQHINLFFGLNTLTISPLFAIPIISLFTLAISFLIIWMLRYVPVVKTIL